GPHADHTDDIIITGFRRNREDVLAGTSVVSGAELTRELRTTIGETLARQPGVSATSFGPNASRPVLRGFQGERVRVLTDGIGSLVVRISGDRRCGQRHRRPHPAPRAGRNGAYRSDRNLRLGSE